MPLFPHRIAYNRLFWVGEGNDILLVGKSIISEIIKNYGYPGLLGDGGIGNGEWWEKASGEQRAASSSANWEWGIGRGNFHFSVILFAGKGVNMVALLPNLVVSIYDQVLHH
jgi:hypothetical protein